MTELKETHFQTQKLLLKEINDLSDPKVISDTAVRGGLTS